MRSYTNEQYIQKRSKLGRRTSLIGLAILAIGMMASFSPGVIEGWKQSGNPMADTAWAQWLAAGNWLYVSMGALLIGFILGQMGNANMRRFQRVPRPDQVIAKALKGFDDRNSYYAFSEPVDIVLAGPAGIYAIATRDLSGKISVVDGKINQPFSLRRLFLGFGMEPGGNPAVDARKDADTLGDWLAEHASYDDGVTVNALVVFTNDNADLDVQSSPEPIIHYKQLKQFLRQDLRSNPAKKSVLAPTIEALDAEAERRGAELE